VAGPRGAGHYPVPLALDWHLEVLGLIMSDFLYLDGQRDRGPVMALVYCDLGSVPADHHTLAMALQPRTGYVHSAYEFTGLDEAAASGEYLREQGYRRAWGLRQVAGDFRVHGDVIQRPGQTDHSGPRATRRAAVAVRQLMSMCSRTFVPRRPDRISTR
jgi:hypothetical protein